MDNQIPAEAMGQLASALQEAWDDFYVRQIPVNVVRTVTLLDRPWKTRIRFDEQNRTIIIEIKDDTNPS